MALDPYSLCPCGSGKKVKFCCNDIVDDMLRIVSMQQNNQLHMALQALAKLRKNLKSDHPGQVWVRSTETIILFEDEQLDLAKTSANEALELFPDDAQLVALVALTALMADGYDDAREALYRAFEKSTTKQPALVADLALLTAQHFMQLGRIMAARKYLLLAMQLSPEPVPVIEKLTMIDTDRSIFFWLRTDYPLRKATVAEELAEAYQKAETLADFGCFEEAARQFEKVANKDPDNSDLWCNTALCLAWSGDESGAIEAFGETSRSAQSFDEAVEAETLCQILELLTPEEGIEVTRTKFHVKSVSKLLTLWDDQERIVPADAGEWGEEEGVAGVFSVLDRPTVSGEKVEELDFNSIPHALATVVVLSADPEHDQPAEVILECFGGSVTESVTTLITETAEGEIEADGAAVVQATLSPEVAELQHNWYFPQGTRASVVYRLERERWEHVLAEVWPNMSLAALDDQTPLESVGDESLQVELTAAVNMLEAICDQRDFSFDLNQLRDRLKVPQPTVLEIDEDTDVSKFPLPLLRRLPIAQLTDIQLLHSTKRVAITGVRGMSREYFPIALERPELLEPEESRRIYTSLVVLCKQQYRPDEAMTWIEKGREFDRQHGGALEELISWDLQEVTLRLWQPDDPKALALLKKLWEETSTKLPQLRGVLERIVESMGVEPPWDNSVIQPAASSASGVWTPDAQQPSEEKSNLWIPGQD